MPRTIPLTPALLALIAQQDGVVTVEQLFRHGLTRHAVSNHVRRGEWQRPLPGVLLTTSGEPTRRQLVLAAHLWAGPDAAIDGASACHWYGVPIDGFRPGDVHVVVPFGAAARSRSFVIVRRSIGEIVIGGRTDVPYVDPATAFIVAARSARRLSAAIAVLSRGMQEGLTTTSSLYDARERLGDKWCRNVDAALIAVGVGLRSPAEKDARDLILTSRILPEPRWNQWLHLDDGGPEVCVDGLLVDAGMALEVIGKKYHAWGRQYDDTNARKERLQAMGLVVCEAIPVRIRREGSIVLAALEQTYLHHAGRGMPPGVTLIDPPSDCGFRAF